MTARFKCEGYPPSFTTDRATVERDVYVRTDGYVVGVDRDAHINRDDIVPNLSPKGWAQFAEQAARLVDEANRAWKALDQ